MDIISCIVGIHIFLLEWICCFLKVLIIGRVLRYFARVYVVTFFAIVAENGIIFLFVASCQKLFVAGCQLLHVAAENFLIVACCSQKCGICCGLRPNFHLLRVASALALPYIFSPSLLLYFFFIDKNPIPSRSLRRGRPRVASHTANPVLL